MPSIIAMVKAGICIVLLAALWACAPKPFNPEKVPRACEKCHCRNDDDPEHRDGGACATSHTLAARGE